MRRRGTANDCQRSLTINSACIFLQHRPNLQWDMFTISDIPDTLTIRNIGNLHPGRRVC